MGAKWDQNVDKMGPRLDKMGLIWDQKGPKSIKKAKRDHKYIHVFKLKPAKNQNR